MLVKEILVVEPFQFKVGSPKRGNAWTMIADILNAVQEPRFRINQRAVRDRYNFLEKAFKKKMTEEEKGSGINPPDLTEVEIGIQEIIEKSKEVESNYSLKNETEKGKAEEMRRRSMETFAETKSRLDDDESPKTKKRRGSETIGFLMNKAEQDAEIKKEELKLKTEKLALQREEMSNQAVLMEQQHQTMATMMENMQNQNILQQQQQQQLMLSLMQSQQQQTQLFTTLLEKIKKN